VAASRTTTASPAATAVQSVARAGHYRWYICALLFFATTINYVDRQVIGVLAPELQKNIGWNEIQYGWIVTSFQAAYAIGFLLAGRLIDRVGTRLGYALMFLIWSAAAISHSLAASVLGFAIVRFALGFGESGNFPAALKTVAEWFPRKERALATGIFNAGANVGAIIAPLTVPWITLRFGWRWAFIATGLLGVPWLVAWMRTYRQPQKHARVSEQELAYIQSDVPEPSVRIDWLPLLAHRQTWAYFMGKFMTDPIWWFFLFWLPKFLNTQHGLSIGELGPPLVAIYVMSDLGSVCGGWLSSAFIKNGWTVNRARKVAMFVCALCVLPIVVAASVGSLWLAVALIGLATAAHQGFSANLFTLPSDMFPTRAVASVVGIGGFGGAVGGMLIAMFTGFLLQWTGSYVPVFALAGSAYLAALLVIHLLVPKMEAARL
jgi:MFS transporter, ACS family, aldohexuronate transporter